MRTLASGMDFGDRSHTTALGGVLLVSCEYASAIRTPSHYHAAPYFCLVLAGGYEESYRSTCLEVSPGSIAYHPAEARHATRVSGAGSMVFRIELGRELADRAARHLPNQPKAFRGEAAATAERMRRELRRRDDLSPLVVESLALELIVSNVRDTKRQPWLDRVVERLRDELASPLSLADLASTAGVHPTHLVRAFRRRYGCTPGEMLRRLRIESAREQLLNGDLPIAQIALDVGFASQSHFTYFYRRETGSTPAADQRAARSDRDKKWRSRKN